MTGGEVIMKLARALSATVLLAFATSAHALSLGITVNGRTDQVYDNSRNLLYFSTNTGQIQRYNPVTNTFLPAWTVGSNLNALDITPDRKYLFAAEVNLNADQGTIYRVDLATGSSTPFHYTAGEARGAFDIVTLNDGRAIFSASHQYSGAATPLRSIDYATGAITDFTVNGVAQFGERQTELWRNITHSTFAANGTNTSAGPVSIFSTSTETYTTQATTWTPLNGFRAAVNPAGTQTAMYGLNFSSRVRSTADFSLIAPMDDAGGGFAYSPDGAYLYTASFAAGAIRVYRTSDYQPVNSISPAGADFFPYAMAGNALTVTDDGRYLYLYSTNGLNVYAVPEPATLLALAAPLSVMLVRRRRSAVA
jgi:hypothetical protein